MRQKVSIKWRKEKIEEMEKKVGQYRWRKEKVKEDEKGGDGTVGKGESITKWKRRGW